VPASDPLTSLLALSTHVVEAVVVGPSGLEASSTADDARAEALAAAGAALLETAEEVRPASGARVDRVAVETAAAAVVVVRDAERAIVVTTVPEPTVGLVVYDLRTTLRALAERPASTPAAATPTKAKRKGKPG
jgi:predicted regulator of Ras-like GTPase activity (Roadblock/LC7/MglB family)